MAQHLCPNCGTTFEDDELTDVQMVKFILDKRWGHLDEWEQGFMASIYERLTDYKKELTDRQGEILLEKYKGLVNLAETASRPKGNFSLSKPIQDEELPF
jgi:hypothetical protein